MHNSLQTFIYGGVTQAGHGGLLDKYDYPPVTSDGVYKEILEQAENYKKYQG